MARGILFALAVITVLIAPDNAVAALPPTVELGPDLTAEEDELIDLSANMKVQDPDTPYDNLIFMWDLDAAVDSDGDGFGDNDNEEKYGQYVDHQYSEPGTYIVTLTVTDRTYVVKDTLKVVVMKKPGDDGVEVEVEGRLIETRTVARLGWIAYRLSSLAYDENVTINISVNNGTGLGLIAIQSEDFEKFRIGGGFGLSEGLSWAVKKNLEFAWTNVLSTQTWYLIVLNVLLVRNNATQYVSLSPVNYTIQIMRPVRSEHQSNSSVASNLLMPALLAVVILAAAAAIITVRRRIASNKSMGAPGTMSEFAAQPAIQSGPAMPGKDNHCSSCGALLQSDDSGYYCSFCTRRF